MPTHVLFLTADRGVYFICDEYTPNDNGRVHILGNPNRYGNFHPDEGVLEFQKAAIPVRVVYESSDGWPPSIGRPANRQEVVDHFFPT